MTNDCGLGKLVFWYTVISRLHILNATEPASITEHCIFEIFEAECPDGHIIVMQSALYGRMRLGRCIQGSSGNVGCVADVIGYFDKQCSGKHGCAVEVSSRSLFALSVCPDYTPYLEVVYNCISVLGGSMYHMCRSERSITLSGRTHPEGLISSTNAYNNRWGSRICPWVIEAEPGQKINISIVDFELLEESGPDIGNIGATCRRYAVLVEGGGTQPHKTVCSSSPRDRNVYISQSHRLEIRFIDIQASETPPNFLLKFSVLGCPDPETNGNILDERTMDKAVLHCAHSDERYHLNCQENTWDSQAQDCEGSAWSLGDIFPDSWSSRQAILIILGIGIGLGVVVGLALVVCALICLKRMFRRRQEQYANYTDDCCSPQQPYGGAKLKNYDLDSSDTGYHTYVRRKTSTMSYVQACDSEAMAGTSVKPTASITDYAHHSAPIEPTSSATAYAQACDNETMLVGTRGQLVMSAPDYARQPGPVEHIDSCAIAFADADDDQMYDKTL